jgi:hypothetical protein
MASNLPVKSATRNYVRAGHFVRGTRPLRRKAAALTSRLRFTETSWSAAGTDLPTNEFPCSTANDGEAAMKAVIGIAMLTLLAVPAHARLTPNDGLNDGLAAVQNVDTDARPMAATATVRERDYFQAPSVSVAAPAPAPRCTIQTVVFEKMRLAQACY